MPIMPLPQQQIIFPRQPLHQPHPIQPRPPQQRASQLCPHNHIQLSNKYLNQYKSSAMAAYVPMRLN